MHQFGIKWPWLSLCLPLVLGCQSFQHQANLGTLVDGSKPFTHPLDKDQRLNSEEHSDLLVESAIAAEDRGDYQLAFSQYHQAIQDNPNHLHGNRRLAALHAKRGQTSESIHLFSKLIQAHPSDPELLCDYAYALYLGDQFTESKEELRKALSLNPELTRARGLRGMIFARTGETDRAISEFADAGIMKAEIHANIALAMLLNGDIEAAESSLETAESYKPKQRTRNMIHEYRRVIKESGRDILKENRNESATLTSTTLP